MLDNGPLNIFILKKRYLVPVMSIYKWNLRWTNILWDYKFGNFGDLYSPVMKSQYIRGFSGNCDKLQNALAIIPFISSNTNDIRKKYITPTYLIWNYKMSPKLDSCKNWVLPRGFGMECIFRNCQIHAEAVLTYGFQGST